MAYVTIWSLQHIKKEFTFDVNVCFIFLVMVNNLSVLISALCAPIMCEFDIVDMKLMKLC